MDKFDLLKKYKALLDEGIINQDDFEEKKRQILAIVDSSDESIEESADGGCFEVAVNNEVVKENNTKKEDISESSLTDEERETFHKDEIYEDILKKLKCNSAKQHEEAIHDLEKLGEWKDSIDLLEKSKAELVQLKRMEEEKAAAIEEKKQTRKKKIRKIAKVTGLIVGIIIALFVALLIIGNALLPDLAKEEKTKETQINGIIYEMPISWKKDEGASGDDYHRYIKEDGEEVIAVADIAYTGENDLTSGDAKYTDTHKMPDGIYDILADCEGTYEEVSADTSVFEVTLYIVPGTVKGEKEFLSWVTGSFNVDDYENPRKSLGIDATYDGSTKAGTVIDSTCEDITVVETFETILGEGEKELEWEIEKPVTLTAGKTSSVVLDIGSREKSMKITCTDMTKEQYKAKCVNRNYKNQLREASYGEYIKIYGQVLQDCGYGTYRISSSGGYDDVYMVYALDSDIVEDDWVTVYGVTKGIYEYETVLGASKKIPAINAKYVER